MFKPHGRPPHNDVLPRRMADGPHGLTNRKIRDLVAYCRGPQCVMAIEAVRLLRKKGYHAHHLDEGVIDWRARSWRVEKSPKEDRS